MNIENVCGPFPFPTLSFNFFGSSTFITKRISYKKVLRLSDKRGASSPCHAP